MDSPSRRRTYDFPKPEAGLAEWTSRIKALQREVDEDEEDEQRKLEEEIRASRLARSRRSGGMQYSNKLDLDGSSSAGYGARRSESPSSPGTSTAIDRQKNQSDALRKLMGEASISPSGAVASARSNRAPSTSSTAGGKSEPISLASFMGGRATGPKLNRPAPQADAHDPTLFEQRARADIQAPHPVFGRGGVALAGLASKGRNMVEARTEDTANKIPRDTETNNPRARSKERTQSTPQPAPSTSLRVVEPSPADIVGQSAMGVRSRVESLYGNASRPVEKTSTPPLRSVKSSEKFRQQSVPTTPAKPEGLRRPNSTQEPPPRVAPSPSFSSSPSSSAPRSSSASVSPPITVPSLARPLQPHPRSPPSVIPVTKNPAPAFLKPPQSKDLTPSLSRLQGRGFVQSLVKLSSELEATATGSPSVTPERGLTPKKSSILDRWQPQQQGSPSPTPSPISAPPLRKSKTMDSPVSAHYPASSATAIEQKRLAPPPKSTSLPSEAKSHAPSPRSKPTQNEPLPSPALPGVGSSNTLISYIKPTKTGDNPPTDQPDRPKSRTESRRASGGSGLSVDELGMRTRTKSNPSATAAKAAVAHVYAQERPQMKADLSSVTSGRPLNHPTKDRARVRRKGANSTANVESERAAARNPPRESTSPKAEIMSDNPLASAQQRTLTPPETYPSAQVGQSHDVSGNQTQVRGENVRRLQDAWANQAPIGVKPVRKTPLATPSSTPYNTQAIWGNKASKQALPGLANLSAPVSPPSPPLTPPLVSKQEINPPLSPVRNARVPSSGSRPTVMDVAQAFNTGKVSSPEIEQPNSPVISRPRSPIQIEFNDQDPGGWGQVDRDRTVTPTAIKVERRRSNYEKYSNFTLPVLPEEKTPAPSPAGTLTKADVVVVASISPSHVQPEETKYTQVLKSAPNSEMMSQKVHIDVVDEPLPPIDVAKIWNERPPTFKPNPDLHTVSVEVLTIEGGSVSEIAKGPDNIYTFYDSETLAVVHRAKSRSSGLVETKVWSWRGVKSEASEDEDKKLQELARRYATLLLKCYQNRESQELVHILGGSLIVRQGKRTLWSSENTTMHRIRSWSGLLIIDEVDLNVKHLCSGFSYCLSLLDTLWVWYGCGSTPAERGAALRYSQTLASGKDVIEVEEGQEDEMFWMFLGDEGYAKADYWKWRNQSTSHERGTDQRIWKVRTPDKGYEIVELETLPGPVDIDAAVLVLHLIYEIFILVGRTARPHRRDILLGLTFAQNLSSYTARTKPFQPPVHVLILPSRIPLDLCAAVRGLDEDRLNNTQVPDHMNLLSSDMAWTHLRQNEWERRFLDDVTMLPLGIGP